MKKEIRSIGYQIPGYSNKYLDFTYNYSLMDADIILISTNSIKPNGDWISFTNGSGGCYNINPSKSFEKNISHLKKELIDFLNSGKTAFILLSQKEEYQLGLSVRSLNKGRNTYSTKIVNNYTFLPMDIGSITSAKGKGIIFSGNEIFSQFNRNFYEYLEYQIYIENSESNDLLYYGKDKNKVLGAIYKIGNGHLVVLPMIKYDEDEFTEKKVHNDVEETFWNKKSITFGDKLYNTLLEIDLKLANNFEKSLPPEWISNRKYMSSKEIQYKNKLSENNQKIFKIEEENEKIKVKISEEEKIKDLLFEKGKALENSVILALEILGYEAEGYNDGELEIDQIIKSPEQYRYIGECEGKDNKDIDITKFRQLQDALNADFARKEVNDKAFGILFGNAERLIEPNLRKLDFTLKCKIGAEREKIALIKTSDLFYVTRYLMENKDEKFRKSCRKAIHENLGKIVVFPKVPK